MCEHDKPALSQAVEDYLKAIYELQEDCETVSTTALAGRLRASPAAATRMLKQLSEQGLVAHTPYYGATLTDAGVAVALGVIRHHRLLELYLHTQLGYSWDEVDAEAERLEHHVSDVLMARIDRLLDYPDTDPHGDPIPGPDGRIPAVEGIRLSDAEAGDCVIVRRVRDDDPEALRYLSGIGVSLGTRIAVCDKQPFNGPLTLAIGPSTHAVGRELAGHVFVEKAPEADHAG